MKEYDLSRIDKLLASIETSSEASRREPSKFGLSDSTHKLIDNLLSMPKEKFIESSMRPGQLSMGGFLGVDESLTEILKMDDETVKRLGLTHEQIASRIEYFLKLAEEIEFFDPKELIIKQREGRLVDGKYLVGRNTWRGGQSCPWEDTKLFMPYGHIDCFVKNKELGEQLNFPGGIVHLIREHHFYEGRGSPYRVDPERAVRILEIKPL